MPNYNQYTTQEAVNKLAVDGITASAGSPTGTGDGNQTVTTAATRVQLSASSVPCKSVSITAKDTNTGVIVVGGSTVVALAGATRRGTPLNAGDTMTIDIGNLNLLYIDATVSGEGVVYTYTS